MTDEKFTCHCKRTLCVCTHHPDIVKAKVAELLKHAKGIYIQLHGNCCCGSSNVCNKCKDSVTEIARHRHKEITKKAKKSKPTFRALRNQKHRRQYETRNKKIGDQRSLPLTSPPAPIINNNNNNNNYAPPAAPLPPTEPAPPTIPPENPPMPPVAAPPVVVDPEVLAEEVADLVEAIAEEVIPLAEAEYVPEPVIEVPPAGVPPQENQNVQQIRHLEDEMLRAAVASEGRFNMIMEQINNALQRPPAEAVPPVQPVAPQQPQEPLPPVRVIVEVIGAGAQQQQQQPPAPVAPNNNPPPVAPVPVAVNNPDPLPVIPNQNNNNPAPAPAPAPVPAPVVPVINRPNVPPDPIHKATNPQQPTTTTTPSVTTTAPPVPVAAPVVSSSSPPPDPTPSRQSGSGAANPSGENIAVPKVVIAPTASDQVIVPYTPPQTAAELRAQEENRRLTELNAEYARQLEDTRRRYADANAEQTRELKATQKVLNSRRYEHVDKPIPESVYKRLTPEQLDQLKRARDEWETHRQNEAFLQAEKKRTDQEYVAELERLLRQYTTTVATYSRPFSIGTTSSRSSDKPVTDRSIRKLTKAINSIAPSTQRAEVVKAIQNGEPATAKEAKDEEETRDGVEIAGNRSAKKPKPNQLDEEYSSDIDAPRNTPAPAGTRTLKEIEKDLAGKPNTVHIIEQLDEDEDEYSNDIDAPRNVKNIAPTPKRTLKEIEKDLTGKKRSEPSISISRTAPKTKREKQDAITPLLLTNGPYRAPIIRYRNVRLPSENNNQQLVVHNQSVSDKDNKRQREPDSEEMANVNTVVPLAKSRLPPSSRVDQKSIRQVLAELEGDDSIRRRQTYAWERLSTTAAPPIPQIAQQQNNALGAVADIVNAIVDDEPMVVDEAPIVEEQAFDYLRARVPGIRNTQIHNQNLATITANARYRARWTARYTEMGHPNFTPQMADATVIADFLLQMDRLYGLGRTSEGATERNQPK
jgi:hypothetical protein